VSHTIHQQFILFRLPVKAYAAWLFARLKYTTPQPALKKKKRSHQRNKKFEARKRKERKKNIPKVLSLNFNQKLVVDKLVEKDKLVEISIQGCTIRSAEYFTTINCLKKF